VDDPREANGIYRVVKEFRWYGETNNGKVYVEVPINGTFRCEYTGMRGHHFLYKMTNMANGEEVVGSVVRCTEIHKREMDGKIKRTNCLSEDEEII
jgi:hypothetical protein